MSSPPAPTERIAIARSAVANMKLALVGFSLALLLWMTTFESLLQTLGVRDPLPIGFGVVVAMVAAFIGYFSLGGHIAIGGDGVLVDRRDDNRFVPFADVALIQAYDEHFMGKHFIGVSLIMHDDEELRVPLGANKLGTLANRNALLRKLQNALARYKRHNAPDNGDVLVRKGRSAASWAQQLKRIGAGANANTRTPPVPSEQLWRIVESPACSPGMRAGAAVALAERLDDKGKQRMRVVADSVADPKLRVLIDCAKTAEQEEELVAALEALSHNTE